MIEGSFCQQTGADIARTFILMLVLSEVSANESLKI